MDIDHLRELLDGCSSLELAVLFGSHATGKATTASDVDIGLLLTDASTDVASLGAALERAVGRRVELVVLNDAPPLLRSEISRHGQVLVERRPYAWADFRAKAMIDWWDWAPTAELVQRTVAARLREEHRNGPA